MGRSVPGDPFYRYVLLTKGRTEATALSYWNNVRVFRQWCYRREVRPEDASKEVLEAYLLDELPRLNRNTIAVRLSSLRAFYAFLGADPNPALDLHAKREQIAPRRPFDHRDLEKLLQGCKRDRLRDMITVAFHCALRVSELVGLRTWDVDLKAGTMLVRGKGKKQRIVHIDKATREALRPYLGRKDGVIWVTQYGNPVTVSRAQANMIALAKRTGVKAHFHRLRTSYACEFLDGGGDVEVLRQIMGHASTETTAQYGRYRAQQRALDQMRRFSSQLPGF